MKRSVLVLALLLVASSSGAAEDDKDNRVTARLAPRNEVPAVSSPDARGGFRARIDPATLTIEFELAFEGLQSDVIMSHIHFAQPNVNGAIMTWLCGTSITTPPTPGPAGTPTCPGPRAGAFAGTISAANVQVVAPQGLSSTLSAEERFARMVEAIRDGLAYVNVHTLQSPGGEIRGQLRARD